MDDRVPCAPQKLLPRYRTICEFLRGMEGGLFSNRAATRVVVVSMCSILVHTLRFTIEKTLRMQKLHIHVDREKKTDQQAFYAVNAEGSPAADVNLRYRPTIDSPTGSRATASTSTQPASATTTEPRYSLAFALATAVTSVLAFEQRRMNGVLKCG
jgi:hypothetical protein